MGKTVIQMNIHETALWCKERDNFLIITHRRPDGDTLGSAAGLVSGLIDAGKTAFILFNPETTARYLPYVEKHWAPDGFQPAHIIAVDIASPGIFQENWTETGDTVSLCIDHHPSNTGYAQKTCLAMTRASCGEVIYEVLMALNGSISAESATALYIAVSTDTGCFSYSNTNANALRVAAALAEAGAPIGALNKVLFRTKAKSRIMLEGLITAGIEFFFDNTVAISTITREMMEKAGAEENVMDDVASIPNAIEGVLVGITIRELTGPEDCKVSIRTTPLVSANELASKFGGGGHAMAAGFSLDKSPEDVKKLLLAALGEMHPFTIAP